MFSHITVGVENLDRAALFYDALLEPLGLKRREVIPDGGPPSLCWHRRGEALPRFYAYLPFNGASATSGNGGMVAFLAPTPSAVRVAYEAALRAGGRDEGPPGLRQHYGPGYFGAYLRDPDGNKVHLVHRPEQLPRDNGTAALDGSVGMMLAYKEWANEITYKALVNLDRTEVTKVRPTRWESIAYTLSHVLVVDDIFRCHLTGVRHPYKFRNVEVRRSLEELREEQRKMDAWYRGFVTRLPSPRLSEVVPFEFVGGGSGAMTVAEMILHVVNHGTYHRGLISDMLCQVPADMPANDLTVFLRDAWPEAGPSTSERLPCG